MELIETELGRVPLGGSIGGSRPVVLVIGGAFPPVGVYERLVVPGCDVATVNLPGFQSPAVRPISVETFARAFDSVIRKRLSGRDITLVGLSTGCLPALAMNATEISARLLVEPFFSTAKLWPLVEYVQGQLRSSSQPLIHEWCEAIFGYGASSVTDRDYSALTTGRRAVSLVGSEPLLPRRPLTALPSLTDKRDRAAFPCMTYDGGHAAPLEAIAAAVSEVQVSSATRITS